METEQTTGKRIYYDYGQTDHKHYFGGYLNLAQNNIDAVFIAFSNRFDYDGGKDKKDSNINSLKILDKHFSDKISAPEFQSKIAFLQQYFPVIEFLYCSSSPDREYFRNNFGQLLKSINDLRNFYTHYYHKPIEFEDTFYELLDSLFFQIAEKVKKHKMKDDKTRHLLKKELNIELTELERLKKEKLPQDKKEGKQVNTSNEGIKNAVLNDAFFHLLYKEGVNRNYQAKLTTETENNISISESGLLFVLGIFLSKKESEDLRSRVKGFKGKVIKNPEKPIDKGNNSLKFMATHWVFGFLGFKGIKHRLTTDFAKETLLIQIVDELSKVPHDLYKTFTEAQQNEFIEDINEYIKEGKDNVSLEEGTVVHPVIRKRYENKFPYLILRYLDEFVDFPTLRFQLHLGNYVHHIQDKIIEGTTYQTTRVIKEKIKVFGKLSEVANLKTNYLENNDVLGDVGWEFFPNPSYNFVSDNIPLFINLQKSTVEGATKLFGKLKKIKSEINSSNEKRGSHKKNKVEITKLIDSNIEINKFKDVYIGEPTAILSLNELPSLLYDLLVNKKSPLEIENRLVEKMIERFDTISNYNKSDNLSTSKITKKLRKSEGDKVLIDTNKLIRAINREKEISEEKLAILTLNQKEVKDRSSKRKHVFYFNELGKEATWLADDIKRFMPANAKANWKGYHHSQLQNSLAFYNEKKNEAFTVLKQFWDFEDEQYTWNIKLKELFENNKTFESFYQKYLECRKNFFTNILSNLNVFASSQKRVKQFTEQQNIWSLFHKRLYIVNTTENQKNKLLAKPFVFPRGIFDDKATYVKGENIKDNPEIYADWYRYTYDEYAYQRFYAFERDYTDLYEKENQNSNDNKYNLTAEQQFTLFIQKHEKKIKEVRIQDLFLKLVTEDIFEKIFDYKHSFSLADFYLTQEERLEKERNSLAQSKRGKGDKSTNIINDNFIWSLPVPYIKGQVNEPFVRIKDIGKFKNFLKEPKVKRLFDYGLKPYWTKKELENEISLLKGSYEEIRREHVLKEIHILEKSILQNSNFNGNNQPIEFEQSGNPNFKLYIANGVLKKLNIAPEEEISWLISINDKTYETEKTYQEFVQKSEITQKAFLLIYIRNKFAHNQLPSKDLFEKIKRYFDSQELKDKTCSEVILNFVKKVINEFTEL